MEYKVTPRLIHEGCDKETGMFVVTRGASTSLQRIVSVKQCVVSRDGGFIYDVNLINPATYYYDLWVNEHLVGFIGLYKTFNSPTLNIHLQEMFINNRYQSLTCQFISECTEDIAFMLKLSSTPITKASIEIQSNDSISHHFAKMLYSYLKSRYQRVRVMEFHNKEVTQHTNQVPVLNSRRQLQSDLS
jgi:hypothetical protein